MSFSRYGIEHDWKDIISGVYVHVSPGSAETLVRRGGITNHHLIEYSLSNICAKKLPRSVDVRWSYSAQHRCRCCFFETQCMIVHCYTLYYSRQDAVTVNMKCSLHARCWSAVIGGWRQLSETRLWRWRKRDRLQTRNWRKVTTVCLHPRQHVQLLHQKLQRCI